MKLLPILLLITSNFAFAQQKNNNTVWHLTIADSVTGKGIDKATVSINKIRYFITDLNGRIIIDKSLIHPADSITISCVGYNSVLFPGINFKFPDTVKLYASVTNLKEVKVNELNAEITIGDIQKHYNVQRITAPDQTFAQFIPNEKKLKGTITKVEYVLNDELHGIEKPFRVRLYTKSKTGVTLDQELTKDSIIVYNPEKKHRLSVDISKYNIELPEDGVIAVFETLPLSYYSKYLIWYQGKPYIRTPGIDMDQKKNYFAVDYDKIDRKGFYSMIGPPADRWNLGGIYDEWYLYADGNNFAITITVSPR